MELKIKRLHPQATFPTQATNHAAGSDLYSCLDEPLTINPHETQMIKLGFSMQLPEGTVGLVFARSGLASKSDLAPANKVGVIDCDYRGEWMVPLHNHGKEVRTINHGERIAQLVVVPYYAVNIIEVDELDESDRGEKGFGSSGK